MLLDIEDALDLFLDFDLLDFSGNFYLSTSITPWNVRRLAFLASVDIIQKNYLNFLYKCKLPLQHYYSYDP